MAVIKSQTPTDRGDLGANVPASFPPLPRGRMRFVLPLLLIAPMPLLSMAATGWQHLLHGREERAIMDMTGQVPVGGSARWSAEPLFPWIERLGGIVAVERQEGSADLVCRIVTYSIETDARAIFRATLCQANARGPWAPVQDAASRWGR